MNTAKFNEFDSKQFQRFTNPATIEKDLQTLAGIIKGVNSDDVISEMEYARVEAWVNAHKDYENKHPYREVISVIRAAFEDSFLSKEESDDIIWLCNAYSQKTGYYDVITSGLQQLMGIVHGIVIDEKVNDKEITFLDNWLEEHDYLKSAWPYDELYSLLTSIKRDGIVTQNEHDEFLAFCNGISGSNLDSSNSGLVTIMKQGFYQIDPLITIEEKSFCITGQSKKYKRREIAEKIELFGGFVTDRISSKVDYLIVCDEKNSCWAFTCYGRKIEQAIEYRKAGAKLGIIHEFDLYDAFESFN